MAAGARGHGRGRRATSRTRTSASPSPTRSTARSGNYIPDFIVCIDDGHGPDDLLNLIVEVTGEKKKDKEAKVATARTLWVPAVNNHGGFGRWAFIEIADPWNAANTIRAMVNGTTRRRPRDDRCGGTNRIPQVETWG